VVRDGLSAACQAAIPPVSGGRFEITVLPEAEVSGCGTDGATVVFWAYVGDRFYFSEKATNWPETAATREIQATFSSGSPRGAAPSTTDIYGEILDGSGNPAAPGTLIEAYDGETLCGRTSLRGGEFEGFVIFIAGPDSIEGCGRGSRIRFAVNGTPTAGTVTNDLRERRDDEEALTLRVP
jgi:hypothetical protein